jgi:simple sugar transport system permease protein
MKALSNFKRLLSENTAAKKIGIFYSKHKTLFDPIGNFLWENRVALMFFVMCVAAFSVSSMSTSMFFGEIAERLGRDTFMVLALLIPVVAGLGLNFGIVLGAMSAQVAMFFVVYWGGSGVGGLFYVALLATPIAIVLGYLIGRLFNKMKGSEMIGGMVLSHFADGFYQFFFLIVLGGIVTINSTRLMINTGVGVLNAIDLNADGSLMRQALDNVSMLSILNVVLWVMVAFVAALVIYRLVKKEPLSLKGPQSIKVPVVVLALLVIAYVASGFGGNLFTNVFTDFLYQDRLNGLTALRWGSLILSVLFILGMVYSEVIKKSSIPGKLVGYLIGAVLIFAVTFVPDIGTGLSVVGFPVFTYLIIAALCVFIRWFMSTRMGQNMRAVGQSRPIATAAGINVDRTRIIAMIMSTVLAAYGQVIIMQNFGVMNTYGAHTNVGLYSVAALLVGGATVARASIKHAIVGVLLFHSLFILAPSAGAELTGQAGLGEYLRVFLSYGVIAVALIMHAWRRVKARKAAKEE